jgi:hypothetical protein
LADADPPDHDQPDWLRTWIGWSAPDRITVAGRDLPGDIMGRLSLTELAFLLVTRREPSAGERRILDAVLVSLADHGLTPSALAARLTYTGAPEAIQGAVAAGLLGAGSVFLGPAGDTAHFLADALEENDEQGTDDARTGGRSGQRRYRRRRCHHRNARRSGDPCGGSFSNAVERDALELPPSDGSILFRSGLII